MARYRRLGADAVHLLERGVDAAIDAVELDDHAIELELGRASRRIQELELLRGHAGEIRVDRFADLFGDLSALCLGTLLQRRLLARLEIDLGKLESRHGTVRSL